MKKKLLAVLLTGAMVISTATGCGNAGTSSGSSTAASSASAAASSADAAAESSGAPAASTTAANDAGWDTTKKDTVVISVINNYYTAGEKKMADEYMKLHPETKVVIDVVADNDSYMTKLQTTMSSKDDLSNAADIIHGNFAAATLGSYSVLKDKGLMMDMTDMLNETNPYNDGKLVKDAFDDKDLTLTRSMCGGSMLGYLPFDYIGVDFFYNKDVLDANNIPVPQTMEDLEAACAQLQKAGYQTPIGADAVSVWLIGTLADAAYRDNEDEFLTQSSDAIYDANTMSANDGFKFDENDMACDTYTVFNGERTDKYALDNTLITDKNRAVWSAYADLGKYLPENWVVADDTQTVNAFVTQNFPFYIGGSFDVGAVIADMNELPKDQQFQWSSMPIPSFKTAPKNMNGKMRSLYVQGNSMSIVPKGDEDHEARVKDVYKYWYSPKIAQMVIEETLANGNFIQGPCCIKGVQLNSDLSDKLKGFISDASIRQEFFYIAGGNSFMQSDSSAYYGAINDLDAGKIDVDKFLETVNPIYTAYYKDLATKSGYDLDPSTPDQAAK